MKYLQIMLAVDVEVEDDQDPAPVVDNVLRIVKTQLGPVAVDVSVADWDVG